MTEAFAPPFSSQQLTRAPVRELVHFEPQVDPTGADLTRVSGYLVVDLRGRLVGRVEGPTFERPAVLTVSFGFLWLRRCLVAAESIELPHNEGVAITKGFETRLQTRAIVELSARGVAVEIALGDTGSDERVTLQVEDL